MMDFKNIKAFSIPEGSIKSIMINNAVIWNEKASEVVFVVNGTQYTTTPGMTWGRWLWNPDVENGGYANGYDTWYAEDIGFGNMIFNTSGDMRLINSNGEFINPYSEIQPDEYNMVDLGINIYINDAEVMLPFATKGVTWYQYSPAAEMMGLQLTIEDNSVKYHGSELFGPASESYLSTLSAHDTIQTNGKYYTLSVASSCVECGRPCVPGKTYCGCMGEDYIPDDGTSDVICDRCGTSYNAAEHGDWCPNCGGKIICDNCGYMGDESEFEYYQGCPNCGE